MHAAYVSARCAGRARHAERTEPQPCRSGRIRSFIEAPNFTDASKPSEGERCACSMALAWDRELDDERSGSDSARIMVAAVQAWVELFDVAGRGEDGTHADASGGRPVDPSLSRA